MRLAVGLGCAAVLVLLSTTAAMLGPREPECRFAHEGVAAGSASPAAPEHLRRDLARVEAEAVQFGRDVEKRPLLSDSIDAREGARTAPIRATAWCRATLMADLAVVHHTTAAALLAAAAATTDQAEAGRSRPTPSAAPVVSRPSR